MVEFYDGIEDEIANTALTRLRKRTDYTRRAGDSERKRHGGRQRRVERDPLSVCLCVSAYVSPCVLFSPLSPSSGFYLDHCPIARESEDRILGRARDE